jgi:hypothetical protein
LVTEEDVVRRLHTLLISRSFLAGLAFALAAADAHAQSTTALQEWTLQNFRASVCVHFLMDSATADKELPKEYRTVRAADFPELSPAVKTLISGEPEYQAWVPAQWCSFYYDQVKVGDQLLGDAAPDLDHTQYLGAWLIAGVPAQESGAPANPSYYIATLRTPNWRWIRLAETSLIRMEFAERSIGKVPEGTDDRFRVEMSGRTVITWDGHLAGDSAWAAPRSEQTWYALNSRGARIRAQVTLTPEKRQNIAGSLQVAGNDPVAKSLRASPIRMVGPLSWGGSGTLSFAR